MRDLLRHPFILAALIFMVGGGLILLVTPDPKPPWPVVYWVTEPLPTHRNSIPLFRQWRQEQDIPWFELRLDTTDQRLPKVLIQGVSGYAADIVGIANSTDLRKYVSLGILDALNGNPEKLTHHKNRTYPAAETEISIGGQQYAFPTLLDVDMLFVNRDAFEQRGLNPPPVRWTLDDFEALALKFQTAAGDKTGQPAYFCSKLPRNVLRRGQGISLFNETLTTCTLDVPEHVELLKRLRHWEVTRGFVPARKSLSDPTADAETDSALLDLFAAGEMPLLLGGRNTLRRLRRRRTVRNLDIVEIPHGGFPNTAIHLQAAGLYAQSDHKELASTFLDFLTSVPYNMKVVRECRGLPPVPKYAKQDAFRRPPNHPEEWGIHEGLANAAEELAVAGAHSPFVMPSTVERIEEEMYEAFLLGNYTASEAAEKMTARVNAEIADTLKNEPDKRQRYDELAGLQERIEGRRAENRPVPRDWIINPFHKQYYGNQGWLETNVNGKEPTAGTTEGE